MKSNKGFKGNSSVWDKKGKRSRRFRRFFKRHIQHWWKNNHWKIVGAIAAFALALGYIGFSKYFATIGEKRTFLDILYLTLQLLALESGSVSGSLPWELEVSRLLSPLIASYVAIKALAVIFWEQFQLLRLKFFRNHVVICGMGRKGSLLTYRLCDLGYRVVAIELEEDNVVLDQIRNKGAIVLTGDATDLKQLRQAYVKRAEYLIAVCGDDGVNAQVATNSQKLSMGRKGKVLTCIVHITDPRLTRLLIENQVETKELDTFRLEFFNIFERGAHSWLKEYPPFDKQGRTNGLQPHLLIVDADYMGENLVCKAAKKWNDLSLETNERLRITLIDKQADEKKKSLYLRYPQLEKACDLISYEMDIESAEFLRGDFLFDEKEGCDFTSIFVCVDDDSLGQSTALTLLNHVRECKIPIVIRMASDSGLAALLPPEKERDLGHAQIYAFGLLDRTCQPDLVLGGTNEILARAIHDDYVKHQQEKGETPAVNPSMVPWRELPEHLRESNRRQADNIGMKLKAVGCYVAPLTDWDAGLFEFSADEIELMAQIEHERWVLDRIRAGWKHTKGQKNIKKKKSPYLVPWGELSEEIKELDRNTVGALPSFLYKVDLQIHREKRAI